MTRPRSRRTAACLVAGLLTSLALPVPSSVAHKRAEEGADPLLVTIEKLTPGAIPASGPITVQGRITNTSTAVWSDLQVYPLTSYEPFTTTEELSQALVSDPAAYVGRRRTALLASVRDLGPGESAPYTLRIPRRQLLITGEQGVYWLGVQVLGDENDVRTDGADGRARTLLPLIDPATAETPGARTSLGMILPFRARIGHASSGEVLSADVWQRAMSDQGRFGRLVALSRTARSWPLTWLVDPALVDVARAVGADNPGLDLGPASAEPETPAPTPTEGEETELTETSPEADAVRTWLDDFVAEAGVRELLALPYGDVDIAAAYRGRYSDVVERASRISASTMANLELTSSPVIDPPTGALPWSAVNRLDPRVPVVLDHASVQATGPRVDVPNGPRLTLVNTTAGDGVPGGEQPTGAFAVRQRVLAEAALHALSPDADRPLVVQLPDRWDPARGWRRAAFFKGLDVPWLTRVSAGAMVRAGTTSETIEPDSSDLTYPEEPRENGLASFLHARDLLRAAQTFDVLLSSTDTVEGQLARMALTGTSAQLREESTEAAQRLERLVDAVRRLMEKVTVSGPTFVTMSSEDGRFPATVTNGLDQPITVGLRARAIGTNQLRIPSPQPVVIPGGQRRTIPMHANSNRIGLWPVELVPVNIDGTSLGASVEFKVRSSHVGRYIWGLLGGSSLVLVVLIFLRVRRRVRARQATPGPLLKGTP